MQKEVMDMSMKTDSDFSTSSSEWTLLVLGVFSVSGEDQQELLIMAKSSIYVNVCRIRTIMMQA